MHFLLTKFRAYGCFINIKYMCGNYYNYNIQKYSVQNNNILHAPYEDRGTWYGKKK